MAKGKNCTLKNDSIRELASKMPEGMNDIERVNNLVGLWQEQDIENRIETYPTVGELVSFGKSIENKKKTQDRIIAVASNILNRQQALYKVFTPEMRKDRANLLARQFSTEVDRLVESEKFRLTNAMSNAKTEVEKADLNTEYRKLKDDGRMHVIEKYRPGGIFNISRDKLFKAYTGLTNDQKVKIMKATMSKRYPNKIFTDEEISKMVNYKTEQYRKIVDHFKALSEEAALILKYTEGIEIDFKGELVTSDINFDEDNGNDISTAEEINDDFDRDESVKEGWMTKFRQLSSSESLSRKVKSMISKMPMVINGKLQRDDLGFQRYINPDIVHALLIDNLKYMLHPDDMMPVLRGLQLSHPWLIRLIRNLEEDDALFSQFYSNYRKNFVNYWVQKKSFNKDGSYNMKTIRVNEQGGTSYLLTGWRYNHENRLQFSDKSIIESNDDYNINNAEEAQKILVGLQNQFRNVSDTDRIALLSRRNSGNPMSNIVNILNMLSIDVNEGELKTPLMQITPEGITLTQNPVEELLAPINTILNGIIKGKIATDASKRKLDMINEFNTPFRKIASIIAKGKQNAIESSIREGGKTYYSHIQPSYLIDIVNRLKNSPGYDAQKYTDFIYNEYKQYPWFFDNDRWLNDWLRQLETDPSFRDKFEHKVVLHYNRTEYSDWDALDYTNILITEYFSAQEGKEIDNDGIPVRWAWYDIPVLSDAQSAEFIMSRKYTGTYNDLAGEYAYLTENGRVADYSDIITHKLVDLVKQEYGRIKLVRARKETTSKPINNYDKVGTKFRFLTGLNTFRTPQGELFINALDRLSDGNDGTALNNLIINSVKELVETMFEDAYQQYYDWGMLTEDSKGILRYFPTPGNKGIMGMSANSERMLKVLDDIYTLNNDTEVPEINEFRRAINSGRPVRESVKERAINELVSILGKMKQADTLSENDYRYYMGNMHYNEAAKSYAREYFWNSLFAKSQTIQILTTDMAFYKGVPDFSKRIKQVHSPTLKLNTKAIYKGDLIGKEFRRTIYLEDETIKSTVLSEIEEILNDRVTRNLLTKYEKDFILSKFNDINVTDGQSYITLDSHRSILGMAGQWTDEMQAAYENFKNGNWNIDDFNIIWQPVKPFMYTQVAVGSNTTDDNNNQVNIKVPTTHKNSEYLLLAMYDTIGGPLANNPKLRAINDFLSDNNIDAAHFSSVVKVGLQGAIDLSDINDYEKVKEALEKAIRPDGIEGAEDPEVLHTTKYEDYGIQQPTPEHFIDSTQLVGRQLRRLATADISDDAIFNVNGKQMTKAEWLKLYNAIVVENVLDDYLKTKRLFSSKDNVSEILMKQIQGDVKYGLEMMLSVSLDENGEFNIPLFDPIQSESIQRLLNSIIRSRITKQKIKGGSLVHLSNYGFNVKKDQNLKIVYEGTGKNKRIKHLEALMPWYSREYLGALMKDGTHELDFEKVNRDHPELLELIGYRIPTEDKYSMLPIKIVGFLPPQSGGSIMLPADITTIMGIDFDIDKLYVMLPEFDTVRKYDKYQFAKDNLGTLSGGRSLTQEGKQELYGNIIDAITTGETAEEGTFKRNVYNAWNTQKNKYAQEDIKKVNYKFFTHDVKKFANDYIRDILKKDLTGKDRRNKINQIQGIINGSIEIEKGTEDETIKQIWSKEKNNYKVSDIDAVKFNSKRARNNLYIDMLKSLLTNSDTLMKMTNPGSFDNLKKNARIIDVLNGLSTGKINRSAIMEYLKIDNLDDIYSKISRMDIEELDNILDQYKTELDPLNPTTQVYLHNQNMAGANLIGVFASTNAGHALMQHTELAINDRNSFMFNGKTLTSLHDITNDKLQFISKVVSSYLAASVDNVKDPVLAAQNINMFTVNVAILLARIGHDDTSIALLLTQPIVKDITSAYTRLSKSGTSEDSVIRIVKAQYAKRAGVSKETMTRLLDEKANDAITIDKRFLSKDLAKYIIQHDDINNREEREDDRERITHFATQMAIADLFRRILDPANALKALTSVTRSDGKGSTGSTIADTKVLLKNAEDFFEKASPEFDPKTGAIKYRYALSDADVLEYGMNVPDNTDKLREQLLASKLPFLQAFHTLSIEESERMLKDYFPHFTVGFDRVFNQMLSISKHNRLNANTLRMMYDELLVYIMSKTDFFGNETLESGDVYTSLDKRREFVNNFPAYFKQVVSSVPELQELGFIKKLRVVSEEEAGRKMSVLVFTNDGQPTANLKESFTRDWANIIYMEDPEARRLAFNLFRYGYYRNGFSFGPNSYMHLAPFVLKKAIPSYVSTLNSILESDDDYNEFVRQFVYNHPDNKQLVIEANDELRERFVYKLHNEGDEFIKDQVTFNFAKFYPTNTEHDSLVKSEEKIKLGNKTQTVYTFYNFISKKVGNNTFYYELDPESETNMPVYNRFDRLGMRYNFIEYQYGTDVNSMKSVINENMRIPEPTIVASDLLEESADAETIETIDIDTVTNTEDIEGRYVKERLGISTDMTEVETSPAKPSILSYPANILFKDDSDQEICGSKLIKKR